MGLRWRLKHSELWRLEVETGSRTPSIGMIAIQDLEEEREEALERTKKVQAKRKEDFDAKLPKEHGIREGGMVLLYDNRHEDFPGKLHTRWMGPLQGDGDIPEWVLAA